MRRHFDHLSDRQYRTHAAKVVLSDQNFQRADGQPSVRSRAKVVDALFPHPVPLR